jgi:hypothetical protein
MEVIIMYESPTIELLGNNELSSVSGAGVWSVWETVAAVAAAAVLVLVVTMIDFTP